MFAELIGSGMDDVCKNSDTSGRQKVFQIAKHVKFMKRMIDVLPAPYCILDSSR